MEYSVEIAGRSIVLRYTVNAMCRMEDAVGGALDEIFDRQFTAARLLLWGGMLEGQPNVTIADVGALIGEHLAAGGSLEQIVQWCSEGLARAGFFAKAAQ